MAARLLYFFVSMWRGGSNGNPEQPARGPQRDQEREGCIPPPPLGHIVNGFCWVLLKFIATGGGFPHYAKQFFHGFCTIFVGNENLGGGFVGFRTA